MKLNSCHSEGDAVPADLTELYDGNIVRRSANCSFVLEEEETNSAVIRPRCKACKGEKSDPPEPEIVILRDRKCEEKAKGSLKKVKKGTLKRSPKVKHPKTKRTSAKRKFQCPICDKFLSSAANLRRASMLATLFFALILLLIQLSGICLLHNVQARVTHQDLTLRIREGKWSNYYPENVRNFNFQLGTNHVY